jgi:opacity protein-like surface antigen
VKRVLATLVLAGLAAQPALGEEPGFPRTRLHVGVTSMQPERDRQLAHQDGHVGLTAGVNWRRSRHLALELSLLETGQQAQMPRVERSGSAPPGSRQDAHINFDGLALGIRLICPIGKLEPYVGAGAGYYVAEISEFGSFSHLVLPSQLAKRQDNDVGTHYMVGVDYALSEATALELEYRRLNLEASFGPEFGGPTRIGGGIVTIAFRWTPR